MQIQPLSYSRQETGFSCSETWRHLPPVTLRWGWNSDLSADWVKMLPPGAWPRRLRRPPGMVEVWLLPVAPRCRASQGPQGSEMRNAAHVGRSAFEVSAFISRCSSNQKWPGGIKCNLFTSPGGSFPNTIAVPGSRPSPEETKGKTEKPKKKEKRLNGESGH